MKFSIIVVCLNPGEKLNQTLDSILMQSCEDYEIVVKDGGSRDGSVEQMRCSEHIRLFVEKDTGIYDAMNQAVAHATGEYILFLNCGDKFQDAQVLSKIASYIKEGAARQLDMRNVVLYGNTYSEKNQVLITSAPHITGFTCYRNIPCHQSCVYAASLCRKKPYNPQWKIRADYDHFLWCYYEAKAIMLPMDLTVASYEGDGFSEDKKNQKRDREEHKAITKIYMSGGELFIYRMLMLCSVAPLRRVLAESKLFSGAYHWLKKSLYRRG